MNDLFKKVRSDFPLLAKKINGKHIVYLDSAATALKPWTVIERISQFNSFETANVHRGAHHLADQATRAFEETRVRAQKFIGARFSEEIIFTKGCTESINLVAQSYARKKLKMGDEVLITEMEHHSNIVPWQLICEEKQCHLKVAQVTPSGELDLNDFSKKISVRTRLVAISHCSNTLGTVNDLHPVIKLCHQMGAVVLVDGAQYVPVRALNVFDLNADFYAFSAHKLFGPYGVGVLYGKKEILDQMPPYQGGGSMIAEVDFSHSTFQEPPYRFEAGTPNIEGIIAFKNAIEYVEKIGFENIEAHEKYLMEYAMNRLQEVPHLNILGHAKNKAPIISFHFDDLHSSDVASILDQQNVAVRSGHLCNQPLMKKLGINGFVRASFSIYNTREEIDQLVMALNKARELLL